MNKHELAKQCLMAWLMDRKITKRLKEKEEIESKND